MSPIPSPSLHWQELATIAFAMAKLHHRPPSDWLTAFEEACLNGTGGTMGDDVVEGVGGASSFSPENLSTLLWSFVELDHSTWI